MREELDAIINVRQYFERLVKRMAFFTYLGLMNFLVASYIDMTTDIQHGFSAILLLFSLFWLCYHAYLLKDAWARLESAKRREATLRG